MIFNEPPPTAYDLRFQLLGIPVRVHPLFWLAALLLGLGGDPTPVEMLFWVGAVFLSILVHEFGHALAARANGWQPWITLHGFGGLASYRPTRRDPLAEILITFAGPAAGFLFAAFVLAVIAASGHRVEFDWGRWVLPVRWEPFSPNAQLIIADLLFINVFWGLVNLLPVYPLDGGQITRIVMGQVNPADGLRQSLWLSVVAAGVVAVLAYTKMHSVYLAIFFAYLAFTSYQTLQAYFGPGGGLGR